MIKTKSPLASMAAELSSPSFKYIYISTNNVIVKQVANIMKHNSFSPLFILSPPL